MKKSAIASLLNVLLFTCFTGPVVAAPGAQDFPTIKYEKYKLANGLEVILKRGSPAAAGCGGRVVSRRAGQ